ncbi:MAG: hypothetical protein WDA15_03700 [Trueperaceae bacterium]
MTTSHHNDRQLRASGWRAFLPHAALALLSVLIGPLWAQAPAFAQGTLQGAAFTGSYVLDTESGPIKLTLQQAGELVTGTLELDGNAYDLNGQLDDLGIYGTVWTGQEMLYFEAELNGQDLYMIMAQVDRNTGAPDPATAGEYLFRRAQAAASPTPAAPAIPGRRLTPPATTQPPATQPPSAQPPVTQPPGGAPSSGQLATFGPPPGMLPAQVGRRYEAGSVVGSADAGVAFMVPPGFYAGYHPQENVFMVISDTQPGLVIVEALSDLDLQSALQQLSQSFASGDATVYPQGQPTVTGNVARASYTVLSGNGALPLYVMGVAGGANNVLIVAGLGAPTEDAVVRDLVERVAASTTTFEPTRASANSAAAQLAGAELRDSASSSNADPNSGFVDQRSVELHLCPNGSYAYAASSQFSVSVYGDAGGGMTGRSDSSEEDYGQWSMVSGLLGPVVVLRSSQGGGDTYLPLLQADGALYVDGLAVSVGRSGRCG